MAVILKEPYVLQRDNHMPKRGLSTSMGIALTLLIAGITVQVTDNLELARILGKRAELGTIQVAVDLST